MTDELYRLEDVEYRYGDVPALCGVNLSIARGECLSVLGANGSGKSTLLKILDALLHPTSGYVTFAGSLLKRGENTSLFRSRVGLVFHEPDVQLFCQTVFDEVAFGPAQLDLTQCEVEERTTDTLKMLGLYEMKARAPFTLSTGEKKKVAIGAVLSVNPDVLLMDEPTSALDPKSKAWLIKLLNELKRAGKTLIMATHDLALAERVSDRAVVLSEAHTVVADGATRDILSNNRLLEDANLIYGDCVVVNAAEVL